MVLARAPQLGEASSIVNAQAIVSPQRDWQEDCPRPPRAGSLGTPPVTRPKAEGVPASQREPAFGQPSAQRDQGAVRCSSYSPGMRAVFALWGAMALCTMGCSDDGKPPSDPAAELGPDAVSLVLTSAGFDDGGQIPAKYTCAGEDVSPPLAWNGVPEDAESLALIVDDPDAPDPAAPKRIWVHWLLYEIPPTATELPEAVVQLPSGTLEGTNDWGDRGYGGPCPPTGRHRYFFRLYALESELGDLDLPKKDALVEAMRGLVIGMGELMGTYE